MPEAITIIIAEDHDLVRRAVRGLLDAVDEFRVVGEAADGEEAVELVERYEPDVAILDFNMPKLNGIQAAQQIRQLPTPPKVIMLTMYSERDLVFQAFDAGCTAYVMKRTVSEELVDAIRESLEGRYFLSQELDDLWSAVAERLGI